MKKILKSLRKIFKAIYLFIDKMIVTPISRIVYNLGKLLKKNNGSIEKILNRPYMLIYISLVFAIGVFFLIDSKVISLVETEAEVLNDQKVSVIFNEEAYVVDGIPETVDITLIGRKSDLYLAKQLGDHEVVLDLTKYGVGEHKVKLSYKQTIDTLNYKLDPSSVLVVIKEKESSLKNITYDLLNQDKLDPKLSTASVKLDQTEVVVKGSKDTLNKVAVVKALIDLNNEDLTEAGTFTLDSVPLVAYDENGVAIKNVEIVPSKISADVVLDSYSAEVPIKIITTGEFTVGTAIASISSSVSKVRIYGEESIIDEINYIPVKIDVTGLKADKTYNPTIAKPTGVRHISEQSTTISVTVGAEASKELTDVPVETRNLGSSYSANATSIAETKITVVLKGVKNVIESIVPSNISAYIDLGGYGPGTHDVAVIVEGTDPRIQYIPSVKTINIKISAK